MPMPDGQNPTPSTGSLADIAASLGVQLGGGSPMGATGSMQSQYLVYLGMGYAPVQTDTPFTKFQNHKPKTGDPNALMSDFENMANKDKHKWALWLTLAGFGGSIDVANAKSKADNMSEAEVNASYAELLSEAVNRYAMGQNLTPQDILEKAIQYRLSAAGLKWNGELDSLTLKKFDSMIATTEEGNPLANRTITSTSKSIDLFSPSEARGFARTALQAELGRDPTQAEYEDFLGALNASARANPNVTTTTQKFDAEGLQASTSSVTRGGIDPGQLSIEKAQRNPDWAEWQAMGTYAPALFSALNAPVPGV